MYAGKLVFSQVMDFMPMHGVRPDNLPGEPARHRGLLARPEPQTLSRGHPRQSVQSNTGGCQRGARLAHLFDMQPSLYTILQVLSVSTLEKTPINQAFRGLYKGISMLSG